MRIVDFHAHVIPPDLVGAMRSGSAPDDIRLEMADGRPWVVHPQGYRYALLDAFHDVGARLAAMDEAGIDLAVLSCPPTLFLYWTDPATAVDAARVVNDGIAKMVAQAPDRFAGVATVPLPDPEAAAAELRRAVRELGLKGAQIGPHAEGVPLDDDSLRPVLTTAADLDVPLIVHPYYVGSTPSLDDFYLTNLQGNPWQTAVCASRLILSGTLDALPTLDVALVHGGGHLPYQIGRLDHGYQVRPEAQRPTMPPSSYLRRFHYDTLLYRPEATRWLIEQVGADRVLYGTDMPFDMDGGPLHQQLGDGLSDDVMAAVAHRNAERLFDLTGRC
ncbi:MAG: Aminocarboxymuconate-semialdehyde decarboxylase [Frankiales bacterium]|nr:Aminocarboxymuconate-semialdehyde decarboxylase [Frankiales bacterium]